MAEEFIAETAIAVLSTVLSRAAEEIKLAWNFKDDLLKLENKLKRIHMLLSGASQQPSNNPLVDDWISSVKKVGYEADEFLDDLAYEALKRRLKFENQSQFTKKVRFFFSIRSNPIVCSFATGRKVKHLMGCIDDVFRDAKVLGIKPVDITAGYRRNSVPVLEDLQLEVQRELVTGRGLIGRDRDEANIIRLLCHSQIAHKDVRLVGIVGMAGLGKTALSKRIFEGDEVKKHFVKRIWVCVSHDFTIKDILEKMIELVGEQTSASSSYQAIVTKLEKQLRRKRYLLVLDDVWDTILGVWESFHNVLLDIGGSEGSVVLATSRSSQVITTMQMPAELQAPTTRRGLIYELKGLNFTDSWSLFQKSVHHIKDANSAERMVEKCAGVPLAIKVLGNLLRQRCLEEWKEIEESELWNWEDKNGILPSLWLSFNYLPSPAIKNCFVYCAIFPEDALIVREDLIRLWTAQGFLHPYDRMEQIGNEYFDILLSNSFFQDAQFNENDKVEWCKMHDVIHAFAKAVARQDYMTLTKDVRMTEIPSDVRHLSLLTDEESLTLKVKEKLRTAMSKSLYFGNLNNLLTHAKCLRVLSLVHAGLNELPKSIGCCKHLRYLDISENYIMKVPSEVGELYKLQTLMHLCYKIRFPSYPTLPKELGKLVHLRHICTNRYSCMNFSLCLLLEPKPRTSQMLHQPKKWSATISDISFMDDIRGSLAIWYLEHTSSWEEARKASLRTKANIHHLDLTWSYNATCLVNPEEVLKELQPHENLKFLSVWYYNGKAIPSRMLQLCNLVEMKIYYCRNLKQFPASYFLPSLKVLVVWGCDSLATLPDLGTMDSLERLQIGKCSMFEDLPNLESLINLHMLEIHDCAKVTSLPMGLASLHNLMELEIGPLCRDLEYFPFPDIIDSSPLTTTLRKLSLRGWSNVGSLPNQIKHFSRLQELSIVNFSGLKSLPSWLGNLTSLEKVDLPHKLSTSVDLLTILSNI